MISSGDLALIGFLAFLEGILSLDNALVLAMMAQRLPPELQRKALTYGLVGAVVFRLIALGLAVYLIHLRWVKFVGGGYLLYVAFKGLRPTSKEDAAAHEAKHGKPRFWQVVLQIEILDIAFAVDSILAAVALTQKFWIVFVGGFIGVVMMRYAANLFIGMLRKFPAFEQTAYLMVAVIGIKVILDGFHFPGIDFHSSSSPAAWIFWGLMVICLLLGFRKVKPKHP